MIVVLHPHMSKVASSHRVSEWMEVYGTKLMPALSRNVKFRNSI